MVDLFSWCEYYGEIARYWRLATKSTAILHLARLEKTRTKEEKPHTIGRWPRPRLCLEQNEERRLGSCTKPYFSHNHHPKTLETKRIPVLDRIIHPTQSIFLRTAEYETRTLGGVRGALRSYLEAEPSTQLCHVFIFLSILNMLYMQPLLTLVARNLIPIAKLDI